MDQEQKTAPDQYYEETYRSSLNLRPLWTIVDGFLAILCIFLFRFPIAYILIAVVWLTAMWLLWFRSPQIIIGSDGSFRYKTMFQLASKYLDLFNLKSADIHVSGKTYVLIVIDQHGNKIRLNWGYGFHDNAELQHTIKSAIVNSNAAYLNRAQKVFENIN
jgi:hypothetical protein